MWDQLESLPDFFRCSSFLFFFNTSSIHSKKKYRAMVEGDTEQRFRAIQSNGHVSNVDTLTDNSQGDTLTDGRKPDLSYFITISPTLLILFLKTYVRARS